MRLSLVLLVIFGALSRAEDEIIDDNDIPELQYMNKSVDPCDDFYEYVCGNFKNVHPLPDTSTLTVDQFTILEEELTTLSHAILSSPDLPEDPVALRKARSAYQACVNVSYVDMLEYPIPEVLVIEEENGFPMVEPPHYRHGPNFSWNDIGDAVSKYGIPMIFSLEAYSDLANASNNVIRLSSDTMANPSQIRPYQDTPYEHVIEKGFMEMGADTRKRSLAPFDIFLRKIAFKLRDAIGSPLSDDEIIENIDAMANFMRGVYQGGYVPDNTTIRNFPGMSVTLKELNEWTEEHFGDSIKIDWIEYMRRIFANAAVDITEETPVLTPSGQATLIYGILNLVKLTDPDTVKDFVMIRIFLYSAPDSDYQTREVFREYYESINLPIIPRWEYCTRKIIDSTGTASLSFAVAYEYQLRYFNVNHLSEALQMIHDLRSSFTEIVDENTWMDDASKAFAKQKIENTVYILGYPEFAANKTLLDKFYENIRICKWDNYGNSRRIRAFKQAYQISQLAKRDRTFWDKSPFEVNAYYNRPNNKIIFPVAVLNPVFFGSNSSILDYGRIGSVIGHEITHGFDAQGQMYNQDGLLQQWWSTNTTAAFRNRTKCFVDQYGKYQVPEIDAYVDGDITLNENIADNGGVRESYRAMKKLLSRKKIQPRSKSFNADQLFFIGFGSMWCNNPSIQYLESQKTGAHSPSKWRVNGVLSNMEPFAEAFNCKAGSNMNPTTKCRLW